MEYQISLFGEGFWERPFMAAIQIIHLIFLGHLMPTYYDSIAPSLRSKPNADIKHLDVKTLIGVGWVK